MFGFSLTRIFIYLAIIAGIVGYFMYTQNQLAFLNQQVAAKDFALKTTTETLKKTQEDLVEMQKVASDADAKYQAARQEVNDIQEKFTKEGQKRFKTLFAPARKIAKKLGARLSF